MTWIKRFRLGEDDVPASQRQQTELRMGNVPAGKPKANPLNVLAFAAMCEKRGLPRPTKEFVFHPTRDWRIDIAWPAHKIALEVHGSVYRKGGHNTGSGLQRDWTKQNEAQPLLGWIYLEVGRSVESTDDWLCDATVDLCARAFARRNIPPAPAV